MTALLTTTAMVRTAMLNASFCRFELDIISARWLSETSVSDLRTGVQCARRGLWAAGIAMGEESRVLCVLMMGITPRGYVGSGAESPAAEPCSNLDRFARRCR